MQVNNNKAKILLMQCVDNACKLIAYGKAPDIKPIQGAEMVYIEDSGEEEYILQPVMPIHQYVELDDEE